MQSREAPIWTAAVAVAIALCASTPDARANPVDDGDWRLAFGTSGGAVFIDRGLGDFRWDTRPAAVWGAHALVTRGRFASGLRVARSQTSQGTGIPGESQAPSVNLTALALVGQVRVAGYRGVELWGSAHAGRMHLGYSPDQLTFDAGGVNGPVTVDFDPITEWDFGGGMEIRRRFFRQVALGLQVEASSFALDTAHRRGDEIAESRDRFYNWAVRLELSWLLDLG